MNKENSLKKITVPIEGMTCASCVARVEKSISKLEGIQNVSVNLATEKATFEYEPAKVSYDDIVKNVESAGYKMSRLYRDEKPASHQAGIEANKTEDKSDYEIQLKKDFITALILTIPIALINMGMMWQGFHNSFPL